MHAWRDRLNRWFTPIARRSPLSPNAITLIALFVNLCAAGSFYGGGKAPALFLAGIALLTIGGLADAMDGIVARVQGKTSRFGDFLDHVADRVSDTSVAAGWMLGSGVRIELVVIGLIAVMLNGYTGTQLEATWHEREYETVGRGEFVLALIIFPIVSFILATIGWQHHTFGSLHTAEWLTLVMTTAAVLGIAQRVALAARMERPKQ
jgi:archaetidylinositol phosphate synthase